MSFSRHWTPVGAGYVVLGNVQSAGYIGQLPNSEARRATFEILDLIGYAAATEPFLRLVRSMSLPEGMDFLYSLIAMVLASDLPDEITEAARSMLFFGFFEDLLRDESPSGEEEEDEEEGDDGGDQGIPIEAHC
jgi:hypothetical protein